MENPKIASLNRAPLKWMRQNYSKFVDMSKVDLVKVPIELSEEEKCEMIKDATIIIGALIVPVTRRMIESATRLKLIQQPTVGYDMIDVEAATEHGIPVANLAGFNAPTVAEHAIMLILSLLRNTIYVHRETCEGNWPQMEMWQQGRFGELGGKTLGILGLGTIGIELAKRARAFGPRIIYHNRSRLSEGEEEELGVEYCSFDELIERSDILSLHVPLTDETRGIMGKEQIDRMKPGAMLVNLSRGGVVDEHALAEALRVGRLSGAGVDVFEVEPINSDNPLIGLDNVILTSHVAGVSKEARVRSSNTVGENIRRILNGENPLNVVTKI
jgi:phosphoglycerate dehydrogenase-like enzyme